MVSPVPESRDAQRQAGHLLPQSAAAPAQRGPEPAHKKHMQSGEERRAKLVIHPPDRAAAGLSPSETRARSLRDSIAQLTGPSPKPSNPPHSRARRRL